MLLCCWRDCRGMVHHKLLKATETVNANKCKYCEQLYQLNDAHQLKRPNLVPQKGILFYLNNPLQYVVIKTDFGWEIMGHIPYFPNIVLSGYCLFLNLQNSLTRKNLNLLKRAKKMYINVRIDGHKLTLTMTIIVLIRY